MAKTSREVLEFLAQLEVLHPTKEQLANTPQPVYEHLICLTDPEEMELVIRQYANSRSGIIPYNLAAAVSYNETTFSTRLLFLLLSLRRENLDSDLILAYLNALRYHSRKNSAEVKRYSETVRNVVKRSLEYDGPARELVHSQLVDFFFSLIREELFLDLFDRESITALRQTIAAMADPSPDLQSDKKELLSILDRYSSAS